MNAKPEVKFHHADEVEIGYSAILYGVRGHYYLGDEPIVRTSRVVDIREDGRVIETMNTIYVQEE